MEATEIHESLQLSPRAYFKNALLLLKQQQIPDALQAIDAAIVFSHHSPFYIYQKMRLLYNLDAYKSCHRLIVSQLPHLYKHGSLYILCRTLDYLQKIQNYELEDLKNLLITHHVPYCLADSYSTLLTQKNKPFLSLAQKAMFQDDYILCLSYCDLYCKIHSETPDILYMKAYSYHMLRNLIQAKNYYQAYLKTCPDQALAYSHMGLISMELGDYTHATYYLQQAATLAPTQIEYLFYLGECYYASKKFEQALATYESIAKLDPNNLQNHFNLSHTYEKLNKRRLSKRYQKCIKKQFKVRRAYSVSF